MPICKDCWEVTHKKSVKSRQVTYASVLHLQLIAFFRAIAQACELKPFSPFSVTHSMLSTKKNLTQRGLFQIHFKKMFVQKPLEKLDFLMKNCLFNKMKSDKSNNIFSKRREVGCLSEGLLVIYTTQSGIKIGK